MLYTAVQKCKDYEINVASFLYNLNLFKNNSYALWNTLQLNVHNNQLELNINALRKCTEHIEQEYSRTVMLKYIV